MTQGNRHNSAIGVLALLFSLSVYAGELERVHNEGAQANNDYYEAIRFKKLSDADRSKLFNTIVAPRLEERAQVIQSEVEKSLAAAGLSQGHVPMPSENAGDEKPKDDGKKATAEQKKRFRMEAGLDSENGFNPVMKTTQKVEEAPATPEAVSVSTEAIQVEEVVFESKKGAQRQPATQPKRVIPTKKK